MTIKKNTKPEEHYTVPPGQVIEYTPLVPIREPMHRTLKTERIYNIGNYQNITFGDEFKNIPEEVMLNEDLMLNIRYLQFISMERAFRKYMQLYAKVKTFSVEQYAEAMTVLENEQESVTKAIKELFYSQQGE